MSAMLYIHTAEPLNMLLWRKKEKDFKVEEKEGGEMKEENKRDS